MGRLLTGIILVMSSLSAFLFFSKSQSEESKMIREAKKDLNEYEDKVRENLAKFNTRIHWLKKKAAKDGQKAYDKSIGELERTRERLQDTYQKMKSAI